MKRILIAAAAATALFGCQSIHDALQPKNPYTKRMFYEKYLNPADPFDARIESTLNAVRADPRSASLHNDLGQLLLEKGFPKDAEAEFERAVDANSRYYPAWYNLGLVRAARGNYPGARFAFSRTVHYKPGHADALFELGLLEEQRKNTDSALDYYAKAFSINRELLDVRVNPRILDSKLVAQALIRAYPNDHAREAMQFQAAPEPTFPKAPLTPEAPSPQAAAKDIVTPAPPVTNPATQTPPPTPKPPL